MTVARALALAVLLALSVAAPARAIVGGSETQRDWPHMAGMEVREADGFAFRCGGSLVRPDVVLSAAHCVDGEESAPGRFRFLLGTRDRESGGERIGVVRIVKHPEWDDGKDSHDVALLKLERPSTLGAPIALAGERDAGSMQPGDPATIIGWGATFAGGGTVRTLREAQVPLVSDPECARSYTLTANFDAPTSICAGNLGGGRDSCQGDSGGPLMVPGADGALVLAGDTSFGVGCALPTQYGVYGEVAGAALKPWIEARLAELSPSATGVPAGDGAATRAPARRTRVALPRTLGSARRARARRRTTVRIATTAPLRGISIRLVQRGRTVAAGRRAGLRSSAGRVSLRLRASRGARTVRAGRATLRLVARDGDGRRVRVARRVRVRR